MNINIDAKTERVLKKILGTENVELHIQVMVDSWIEQRIRNKYKSEKTVAELKDELDA